MLRVWLRRLAYLGIIAIWLGIMIFPPLAFVLAVNGEIQLGKGPLNSIRVFLIQSEDEQGLGLLWSRRLPDMKNCAKTSLTYFLWEGSSEEQNVSYCQCYDPETLQPQPAIACPR